MGVGRRGDNDGVSLDLINQFQGIGQALCGAEFGLDRRQGGGICIGQADDSDIRPPDEPIEMFLAKGARASDQDANGSG